MKLPLANLATRLNRRKVAFEVEEELRFHVEMLERKYTQQGMSVAEAKTASQKRFGNLERVKRECVDISKRKSLSHRVLKTFVLFLGFLGLLIRIFSADYQVGRIGEVLIMIAVAARLLLYVRGLRYRLDPLNQRNLLE